MAKATTRLTTDALTFLAERHLAMLTTLRLDNSPHVVAVGFTFDPKTHIARVITTGGSQKAVNAAERGIAVLSQVDGGRWLSLEGRATVNTDIDAVRDAELRYAQRYRTPRLKPRRVVIEVRIERVLGSAELLEHGEVDAQAQFKVLVSSVKAQNLRNGTVTRVWRADDGTSVTGWRIEQIESYRKGDNPSPGTWFDDWLDADYVLSTDGKIYEYRFWMYEDDHTAKDSGRTLIEVPADELAGRQGAPYSAWSKKLRALKAM